MALRNELIAREPLEFISVRHVTRFGSILVFLVLLSTPGSASARLQTVGITHPDFDTVDGVRLYVRDAGSPQAAPIWEGVPQLTDGTFWIDVEVPDRETVYLSAAAFNAAGEGPWADEVAIAPLPYCGDGAVDSGETCDDGNTAAGDGCDALCQLEPAPPPEPDPTPVPDPDAVCGDGMLDPGELCDDGNQLAGDGCDASCALEPPPDDSVAGLPYFVNVGGGDFVDGSGALWLADTPFVAGGTVAGSDDNIARTNLDPLYNSQRRARAGGRELRFELPVPALGRYRVRLHFAEVGGEVSASGQRVFDVLVDDGLRAEDIDVFDAVGARKPYVREVDVLVGDGILDVTLVPFVGDAMLSAIEIHDAEAMGDSGAPASPGIRCRPEDTRKPCR